jgi:hypothetical protein
MPLLACIWIYISLSTPIILLCSIWVGAIVRMHVGSIFPVITMNIYISRGSVASVTIGVITTIVTSGKSRGDNRPGQKQNQEQVQEPLHACAFQLFDSNPAFLGSNLGN